MSRYSAHFWEEPECRLTSEDTRNLLSEKFGNEFIAAIEWALLATIAYAEANPPPSQRHLSRYGKLSVVGNR